MTDCNAKPWSLRLVLVCLAALSVSLPMAWISLAKVFVFVATLLYLISQLWTRRLDSNLEQLWTPWVLILLMLWSAGSLGWTAADLPSALVTFVKHAKLLEIVLLVILIRTAAEARIAITAFAFGQAFLLLSSWLMFVGIDVPWHAHAPTPYVVFSTYLDQSIMFATAASVFWHLRNDHLWPSWIGTILAILGLANVFLLLEGRTGYLVALTSLSLGLMWTLPQRMRLAAAVIAPITVFSVMFVSSAQLQERVSQVVIETQSYVNAWGVDAISSSGWRLNAWHRSLQAISDAPLVGHGVGAWPEAVKRMEGTAATQLFGEGNQSNPHQEYLLWGVELGVGGFVLFLVALACMARDASHFATPIKRATLGVLGAAVVACLFNSALYDDLMGDFFCVSLGLLMAIGTRSMVKRNPKNELAA
jgi:O-antigen ligase